MISGDTCMNGLRTCLGLCLIVVGLFANAGAAAEEPGNDDPFASENGARTIFKLKNEPTTGKVIDFRIIVIPGEVRRGEIATLIIVGVPKAGYHTYPLT